MTITDVSWRKQAKSGLGRVINVDTSDASYPWMVKTVVGVQRRVLNADGTRGPIDPFGMYCTGAIINYSKYILPNCG